MIKFFSRAFKITNENIILATPLVLFLFLMSIYLEVAQKAPANLLSALLLLTTILFMVGAFFAGWLYMVRKAVELDKQEFIIDEDKAKASFNLIKEIAPGVGEYFLPVVGALILYVILFCLILFASFEIGLHFIGKIGLTLQEIKMALASPVAMKSLVSSLSSEQLQKLNLWNILLMSTTTFFSFLTMFWGPQMIFKTKNPFLSLFKAVKFTFCNFISSLLLFIYISFINFTVSLLNAVSMINPIVYFLSMIIYFYFLVYVVVLVFLYYDRQSNTTIEYVIRDEESGKQSDSTKSDSNSGTDGVGKDESGDSNRQGD